MWRMPRMASKPFLRIPILVLVLPVRTLTLGPTTLTITVAYSAASWVD